MDGMTRGICLNSCNALVCVCFHTCYGTDDIYIWNPATRCHRILPSPETNNTRVFTSLGFGYDHSVEDYKIIRHCKTFDSVNILKFAVFSVKTGMWRMSREHKSKFKSPIYGQAVYFNRAMHWVVKKVGDDVKGKVRTIMAFGLTTEKHYEVLPPKAEYSEQQVSGVLVLEECLCALFHSYEKNVVEFWAMKDYNLRECWTKLAGFPQNYIGQPLFESVTGETLMIIKEKFYDFSRVVLSLCNFKERTSRRVFNFKVNGVHLTSSAIHLEGLPSPY